MPVFIEKIKIDNNNNRPFWSFIDFVLGNFSNAEFYFTDDTSKTSIVKNLILAQLEIHNIFLGKNYGTIGVSVDQLLNDDTNFIVEIPVGHLQFCDVQKLVTLSTKNKIILTDLEEGNSYFFTWIDPITNASRTGKIDDFLKTTGINVENVFFLNTGFNKIKFCQEIKILNFWVVVTALCSPFVLDIINNGTQQKYIDLIRTNHHKKFAIFKNWRARKWRVILLSLLYNKQLLHDIDWSLIGEYHPFLNKHTIPTFELTHFLRFTEPGWVDNNPYKNELDKFFNDNINQLPKFLEHDYSEINSDSLIQTYEHDIKKYRFSIDIESHTSMSEKIVKSFLLGYMPIIAYTSRKSHYIKQIKKLGFRVLDEEFDDCNSVDDIILKMYTKIEYLHNNNLSPSIDDLVTNFCLCTDKELLAKNMSQPLIDSLA